MNIGLLAKGTKYPLFCLPQATHARHTNTPALFPQANHVSDIRETEESLPALLLLQAGQTYKYESQSWGEALFPTRRASADSG